MFKITKDGATVAMTEAPNYIKQAENGCFVLCPEAEATGIAHNGTVYHLLGRADMEGAESTVILEETDAGAEISKATDATGDRVRHHGGGWKRGRNDGGGTRGPFRAVGGAGGLYRGPDPQIYGREAV